MNKIIIYMTPVAPCQQIYIFKNEKMVDKMGIQTDDLVDVVFDAIKQYQINEIDFSGSISYARAFGQKIHEAATAHYQNLTINYINSKGEVIK